MSARQCGAAHPGGNPCTSYKLPLMVLGAPSCAICLLNEGPRTPGFLRTNT